MNTKIYLSLENETIKTIIEKSPPSISFKLNCYAKYENGKLIINAIEEDSPYESKTREEFILSTEYHNPKGLT